MVAAGWLIDDAPTIGKRLVHCDAVFGVAECSVGRRAAMLGDGLGLARLAPLAVQCPTRRVPVELGQGSDAGDLLASPRATSAADARDYIARIRYAVPEDAA